jgi:hypothetical protein
VRGDDDTATLFTAGPSSGGNQNIVSLGIRHRFAFKDRYNRDWRVEKQGFMSPLEARQARLLKQAA